MTAVLATSRCRTGAAKPLRGSRSAKKWTPQIQKYHLQWRAIFEKHGWADKPEKEKRELRHSILADLFDEDIALSCATDLQWDIIYFAQELLLDEGILIWSKEMAHYAREEGTRKRYIWNIDHAGYDVAWIKNYGAPEEYVESISEDKFGVKNWRCVLNSKQLWQLFITIKNRVRKSGGIRKFAVKATVNDDDPF